MAFVGVLSGKQVGIAFIYLFIHLLCTIYLVEIFILLSHYKNNYNNCFLFVCLFVLSDRYSLYWIYGVAHSQVTSQIYF